MKELDINELKSLNKYWIENVSNEEKIELENLEEKEIIDRYYTELEFGTAGLRGVMELGRNRMNIYTVSRATQAIAQYIIKRGMEKRGVAVLYDTRNNSKEFAENTARVLIANGIKVYLFDKYRPVPVLSFSTKDLNAFMGIMITASHNPKEYNGYKVFDETGLQIGKKVADEVMENILGINIFDGVNKISEEKFKEMLKEKSELLEIVGENQERRYLDILKTRILNDDEILEEKKKIKVVYTPLHGAGDLVVNRLFKELGYENIISLKEQQVVDGVFGTVKSPNPENEEAFEMAKILADKIGANICIGTDPDCDRLGVLVRKNGVFKRLTGNQIGILMLEYILSQMKEKDMLNEEYFVSTSIVSTNLTKKIASSYGIKYYETLTGFKNICSVSENNKEEFLFGFEESFGYLYGNHARDKDGVVASMLMMELITYYSKQGKDLFDVLGEIYIKYGYYFELGESIVLKGIEGKEAITRKMETLRNTEMKEIEGERIVNIIDYDNDIKLKSNVLYYELENDAWIAVRPSGTEPKIKFYIGVCSDNAEIALEKLEKLKSFIKI